MDAEIIRIIRNVLLTPEQAEEQIKTYSKNKLHGRIAELMSQLPPPKIIIETGENPQ